MVATCNVNIPPNRKYKKCVDKKFMGGHKNAFINHYSEGVVYCGKLLNNKEKQFYNYLSTRPEIKRFFPNFYGLCKKNKNDYMIIENVFMKLKPDYKFVDLKIGHRTAYSIDSGIIKNKKHNIMDKYLSTTSKEGFRIEGLNFKINNKFVNSKIKRHSINPTNLWKSLLINSSTKLIDKLLSNLKKIINMLYKNLFNKNKFALIGTSILIAHDNNNVIVKLIDFSHPFFGSNDFNDALAEDMYFSVLNLYQSLLYFLEIN